MSVTTLHQQTVAPVLKIFSSRQPLYLKTSNPMSTFSGMFMLLRPESLKTCEQKYHHLETMVVEKNGQHTKSRKITTTY